jgi:predicted transcriptional regulator
MSELRDTVSGVDLSMSRWLDTREDTEAAEANLEKAVESRKKGKMNKRACPKCGEMFKQLPQHLRKCNE